MALSLGTSRVATGSTLREAAAALGPELVDGANPITDPKSEKSSTFDATLPVSIGTAADGSKLRVPLRSDLPSIP
jgi:hypothetical protein